MTGALLTLLNAPTLAAYTASGLWGHKTIFDIAVRHARAAPPAFAVRDLHRRLTYPALVEAVDQLAASLAGHGVRSGERVAVWLASRVAT
jgi:non-ribosomal peptide synthetase component E (peptide arylation enzyme)